jgi:hypothetical protein
MNKAKLAENRYGRVRLWPLAQRRMTDGTRLPPIDDDWMIEEVSADGVVRLKNLRTDHVAQLGTDRIHHFDREPHRDWDGFKHGRLEVRVRLVLSGCHIHYLPLPTFRPRRRAARISR